MEGWIKLHRKLKDNPIYTNSRAVHCWVECLLRASHNENTFYLNRQKVHLKKGQFAMGRDEFGKSIGMSGSTAWFWLLQFEADSMVDIKRTTRGSVVTIKSWSKYQQVDSVVDNKKTTDEQQMNTIKNDKNDKNDKKIIKRPKKYSSVKDITEEDLVDISQSYKVSLGFVRLQFEKMKNWLESSGKTKKDYKATLRNFVLGDMQKQVERRQDGKYRPVDARHIK